MTSEKPLLSLPCAFNWGSNHKKLELRFNEWMTQRVPPAMSKPDSGKVSGNDKLC